MATHKPINILEAFAAAPPPLDYVLPNMVAGTVGALVSPGGAGKSMLALQLAAQLHRPLSWLCFQMYAILLLQLMDHRKQVTRLGIPFRPEHPYETHARLLLL